VSQEEVDVKTRDARAEQRFSAEEADVSNISRMQNGDGAIEQVGIYPAQIFGAYFAAGEVAEIAPSVASVGDGDIAKRGAAAADHSQNVPSLGRRRFSIAHRATLRVSHLDDYCPLVLWVLIDHIIS
jgi:hypothetical protein